MCLEVRYKLKWRNWNYFTGAFNDMRIRLGLRVSPIATKYRIYTKIYSKTTSCQIVMWLSHYVYHTTNFGWEQMLNCLVSCSMINCNRDMSNSSAHLDLERSRANAIVYYYYKPFMGMGSRGVLLNYFESNRHLFWFVQLICWTVADYYLE